MIGIPSAEIPSVWHWIEGRINAALAYGNGEYEAGDIYEALVKGHMQLWLAGQSIAVTTIIRYPRRTKCLVVAGAGDLETLRQNLPLLEAWAKAEGSDEIEILGRKGWVKALPDYEQAQVHLRKDL